VMDPSGGNIYDMPIDQFMKEWSDIHTGGMHSGVNHQILTYVPDDDRTIVGLDGVSRRAKDIDLPSNGWFGDIFSDAQPARVLDDAKADAVNNWEKIKDGQVFGGVFGEVGAIGKFIGGGIGFALTDWVGYGLESAGSSAIDWANDKWNNGGFFGKVGAVFGWAGGGILEGLGWGFSKIGDGLSWGMGKIGDGLSTVGGWIDSGVGAVVDGAKDVGNAVVDGAKAVGNAVSDAWDTVSGWF
jgi:hypothetical protein